MGLLIATASLFLLNEALPVSYSRSSLDDLSFLASRLKGKSVVQIGEATHGGAEFYLLKTKLVRYMHEKLGVNVLALECGMLETGLVMSQRKDLTPSALMKACLFVNYRWREMVPLFEYLKNRPQLKVIGIDPQFSSDDVLTLTRNLLKPYDETLAEDAEKHLGDGYAFMGRTGETTEFRRLRDGYLKWLTQFGEKVRGIRPKPEDVERFDLLIRSINGLKKYWNYEPSVPMMERLAVRDNLMAESLLGQTGKDKVILWAHNGHIGKGLGYPILGDHLRKALGDKTYALGLFAQKGDYYQHCTKTSQSWGALADGLESRFPTSGEGWFRDAKDFANQVKAYEPENGGIITFIPADRFDGLIVLTKLSVPKPP
ncbi:MAG: erythromycin esterase family protein [Fimbriimonadaceae bacterium]|nr:erythromycin esterase family protein [Fimbriimonadaceae bacterium]